MTYISKHHSKQKWKDCYREQSWIHLLISWNTISVNNLLERSCKIICFEMSWWTLISSWLSHGDNMRKSKLKKSRFIFRNPDLSNHCASRFVLILNNLEHIKCIVDNKFFFNKNSVSLILRTLIFSNRNNIFQILFQSIFSHKAELFCIINSIFYTFYLLKNRLFISFNIISLCGKRFTYSCHLVGYRCT